ncbi:uncharacterized protein LOC109135367 isoform X2 [Beta vulgaris subsp. vulgaris]|uniref:uncharacterized protein LOC109135367 isoform X2 n=1 Tax=Beta vulgaris subsp. vulgaris TaxID=3555 RepID=UPI002548A998|nr:uncharacterized protein LOC109135367 isoform X2 [Beta vulgaris subsp. vulgaris]
MAEQAGSPSSSPVVLSEQQQQHQNNLLWKDRLHVFTCRARKPAPVYHTINEAGPQDVPKFRSTVKVDGETYSCLNTFSSKKAAEKDVAKVALEGICKKMGWVEEDGDTILQSDSGTPIGTSAIKVDTRSSRQAGELRNVVALTPSEAELSASSELVSKLNNDKVKSILHKFAAKMNMKKPKYETVRVKQPSQVFTSLVLNGMIYTGEPTNRKEEAEKLAARAAILYILVNSGLRMHLLKIVESEAKLSSAEHDHKVSLLQSDSGTPIGTSAIKVDTRSSIQAGELRNVVALTPSEAELSACSELVSKLNNDKVKSILHEFAAKMNMKKPKYETVRVKRRSQLITSLVLNEMIYTGEPTKRKIEAKKLAARAAILSILANSGLRMHMLKIVESEAKLSSAEHDHKVSLLQSDSGTPIGTSAIKVDSRSSSQAGEVGNVMVLTPSEAELNTSEELVSKLTNDKMLCKSVLHEFAAKMNMEKPKYDTVEVEVLLTVFTSSLVFNGMKYTGEPSISKIEAEQLAARAAILSILANSGLRMHLLQIVESKAKLNSLVHDHISGDTEVSLLQSDSGTPIGTSAIKVDSRSSRQAGELGNVVALTLPDADQASNLITNVVSEVHQGQSHVQPRHESSEPRVETISQTVPLPIAFVPSFLAENSVNASTNGGGKKGKKRKRANKKAKTDQASNLITNVVSEVHQGQSHVQPRHESSEPRVETISQTVPLPIAFVPSFLAENSVHASTNGGGKKGKKRKRANKKAKTDQASNLITNVVSEVHQGQSHVQPRHESSEPRVETISQTVPLPIAFVPSFLAENSVNASTNGGEKRGRKAKGLIRKQKLIKLVI